MSDFNTNPYIIPQSITRPLLALQVGDALMGIQQLVAAGKQADGKIPDSTPTVANGLVKYPAGTTDIGGLFDFGSLEALVVFLELDFATATTITIKIVNLDDSGVVIAGESVTYYTGSVTFYSNTVPIRLTSRQAVQVTTSAATGAMVLRAKANLERVFRG